VGERGPAHKATPTYPEVCCHSLSDLEILNSRPKTSYAVDEETLQLYQDEIIPFWRGRSLRDRLLAAMTPEWKDAYEAGIFTEFMEQRTPGHTVLGDKIYTKGLLDIKKDIEESLARLDFYNDPEALDRQEELEAMSIAADGLMIYASRYAELARSLAAEEKSPQRKKNWKKLLKFVTGFLPTPRVISGKLCNITGLSMLVLPPNIIPGILLTRAGLISIFILL